MKREDLEEADMALFNSIALDTSGYGGDTGFGYSRRSGFLSLSFSTTVVVVFVAIARIENGKSKNWGKYIGEEGELRIL